MISKLACLSQTSLPSPERSLELLNRLRESSTGLDLDRFGLAVAADDLVFSLVAWNSDAHPGGNPLLFVDESYDEPTQTTLYAGLLITPGAAFTLFGWYLGNLVTIRKQVPAFWPIDQPPPRLHFRELFNDAARQKTNWRHLPDQAIRDLISVVADAIGGNERVYPFVVRILNVELDKALKSAFPGGVNEEAADDLVGMIVAHALTATVVDNTRRGIEIDVVIDYDATRIYLAKMREEENVLDVGGRRQATQRFMEAMRAAAEAKNDPRLVIPSVDRFASRFPSEFTWARFTSDGYPMRPLIDVVGLQFADLYVNSWRHLEYGAYPNLRVSRKVLTRAKKTDYFWAPEVERTQDLRQL